MTKESNDSLIHSQEHRGSYLKELFRCSSLTLGLIPIYPSGTMQVHVNPPWKMEITLEMRLLRRQCHAIRWSITLLRGRSRNPEKELTKLLESIWIREQVPEEWCSSVNLPIFMKNNSLNCFLSLSFGLCNSADYGGTFIIMASIFKLLGLKYVEEVVLWIWIQASCRFSLIAWTIV